MVRSRAGLMPRLLFGAVLAVWAVPALADTPPPQIQAVAPIAAEQLAEARRVVDLAFPADSRVTLFTGAQDTLIRQMRAAVFTRYADDPGAKAIAERALDRQLSQIKTITVAHIPDIIDAVAHAYAREFSLAELHEIGAFVATPAGHHYLMRSAALLADPDVAAANMSLMREAMAAGTETREALTRELEAYFKAHPSKSAGKN